MYINIVYKCIVYIHILYLYIINMLHLYISIYKVYIYR